MLNCPKCNTEQSKIKVMVLTNFSSIECPQCKAKLKASKGMNSLIGGIGGGTGAYIGFNLVGNHTSLLLWASLVAWAGLLILAQFKLTKLYVSKT